MLAKESLYPEIEPYRSGFLPVDNEHNIYWEESGNSHGKPILFLHGGPGSGTYPKYRRFFDPAFYRIILVDQRGSGKSFPHASLKNNTTWHLVEDLEKLRKHLTIEKWILFGGSWGGTLALAYAETVPQRVAGLILRGIFLSRKSEIDWFYRTGTPFVFPEAWERFISIIPPKERKDLIGAYYRLLTSSDEMVRRQAAKEWSLWEGTCASMKPDATFLETFTEASHAESISRIECHYFMNDCFFKTDGWLLEHAPKIRNIPGVIIHGRYDMICPVQNAVDLHKAWPESRLEIIPDAGHLASEEGITQALIRATKSFCHRI